MTTESTYSLGRLFADLLQFKRGEDPDILYTVQPVLVVGDVSAATPFVSSPRGILGGTIAAQGVGTVTGLRISSRSQGGTLVRGIHAAGASPGFATLIDSAQVFTPIATVTNQVEVGPMVTVGEFGHVPLVPTALQPLWDATVTSVGFAASIQPPEIFLPNGSTLLLLRNAADELFEASCQVTELPALRGD